MRNNGSWRAVGIAAGAWWLLVAPLAQAQSRERLLTQAEQASIPSCRLACRNGPFFGQFPACRCYRAGGALRGRAFRGRWSKPMMSSNCKP
jgi:hypothetical protein